MSDRPLLVICDTVTGEWYIDKYVKRTHRYFYFFAKDFKGKRNQKEWAKMLKRYQWFNENDYWDFVDKFNNKRGGV